jgi:phage gpG-like protein
MAIIPEGFDATERRAFSFATMLKGDQMWNETLQTIGDYVLDTVMKNFLAEGDPITGSWQELSESRQNQRNDNGLGPDGPKLIGEKQKLINSWNWEWLDNDAVIIGMTKMPGGPDSMGHYGAWNQLGTAKMPARPMLVLTNEMIDRINELFEQTFDGHFVHFFGEGV